MNTSYTRPKIHLRGGRFLLPAAFLGLVAAPLAMAQTTQQSEVTVQGVGTVTRTEVGRSSSGIPVEQVQLTRRVSYRDLNLATPTGQDELRQRIRRVAYDECDQLQRLYPDAFADTSRQECVNGAIRGATAQVSTAVATAEQSQNAYR